MRLGPCCGFAITVDVEAKAKERAVLRLRRWPARRGNAEARGAA